MEIDFGVLIGQLVNFAILFVVLSYFVYKPFLNILKTRREKIEDGVRKSQEAEKRIQKIEEMKIETQKKIEDERKVILSKAESDGKNRVQEMIAGAENEKLGILNKAKKDSEDLKEKSKEQTKQEVIENAFDLAEKLLKENIDTEKNKKITAEFLSKLN